MAGCMLEVCSVEKKQNLAALVRVRSQPGNGKLSVPIFYVFFFFFFSVKK